MNNKHGWTSLGINVVTILVLLLIPPMAGPAAAGSPSGALDAGAIDAFVRAQVQRHGIPGLAVAVVDGTEVVHLAGYGIADPTGRAVTPQTPFVLTSVSKPLTALAVMQLVEAGAVDLDAPIQRYVPEFRLADAVASRQITVRHLLQHTSGIAEPGCSSRAGAQSLQQFVAELHAIAPHAPAGTRYEYCSGNYNVLGRLIEVVSNRSFAAYMQQHVFAPLAMHHSFGSEADATHHGLAHGYRWIFGFGVPYHDTFNPSQLPSGSLISSAEHLAHFLVAQLNGGRFGSTSVLSPEGIAAMQAPGVPTGADGRTYGLGWRTETLGGVPVVLHDGVNWSFHAQLFMQPQTGRGAVLLMNSMGMPAYLTAFNELEGGVARLLAEQPPTSPSALSLRTLYLIMDVVLGGLLALVLWPLLRLRRWVQQLRQQGPIGRWRLGRIGLRLVCEIGVPLLLLAGVRMVLGAGLGAQSWTEILMLFPDVGSWLWAVSLLLLLTGALRLVLVVRVWRRDAETRTSAPHTQPTRHAA